MKKHHAFANDSAVAPAPAAPARRKLIKSIAAVPLVLSGALGARPAAAADFPSRPITLIVPWTPGGSTDGLLRQLAQSATKVFGQSVVPVNKPGAGGALGAAQMAATAAPDGYTVAQVATSLLRLPHLQKTTYDPLTDFSYIIGVSAWPTGIMVRADSPFKSWKDVVERARANPGAVSYASSGVGSSTHIFMEEIARAEKIELLHVPYKGASESTLALLGGDVMLQAEALGGVVPQVDSGKMRILVTWGAERNKRWPGIPTLREVGVDIVAVAPNGLAGPKGMDPSIVKILHDGFKEAMADPAYREVADRYLFEDFYRDTESFRKWAVDEYARQGRALKAFGLTRS